jgi:microcystin-dependent protein
MPKYNTTPDIVAEVARLSQRLAALERVNQLPASSVTRSDGVVVTMPELAEGVAEVQSDGLSPAEAPTLIFAPGIGTLYYRWNEIDNHDVVTYRLHVREGEAPTTDGTYEVASGIGLTIAAVRKLKDGSELVMDGSVNYYATITVEDVDTPDIASRLSSNTVAGPPAQVEGPDLSVNAVTANYLIANNAILEALNAVDMTAVTITGATYRTGTSGARTEIDIDGFRSYAAGLDAPFINASASERSISSDKANTRKLTVSSDDPANPAGSSLGGTTEIATGGRILLTSGTTAPAAAPSLIADYQTQQFANDNKWINRRGWTTDGTNWYTVNIVTSKVEKWSYAGVLLASGTISIATSNAFSQGNIVWTGTRLVALVQLNTTKAWWFCNINTTTLTATNKASPLVSQLEQTNLPVGLSYDPDTTEFITAQTKAADELVRFRRWTFETDAALTGLPAQDSIEAYSGGVQAFVYTSDPGFNPSITSGLRYVISHPGAYVFRTLRVLGGVTFQPGEYWASAMTSKVGLAYSDGTFKSMDRSGTLRHYTSITSTVDADPNMTKWVSNTLANATYETDQSPRASMIYMPKRSRLVVTTSSIPAVGDADRVRIYVGQGATDPGRTGMARQANPLVGVTQGVYTSLVAPPGTNPPATNNFPVSAGSSIEGDDYVFIRDTGEIPPSPFRDAIFAILPSGTMYMWPAAAAPSGFLLCDGTVYNNVDYPELSAVLGNTFGGVAGTSFAVPDMRGRHPIGVNPEAVTYAGFLGYNETGTLAVRESRLRHIHSHVIPGQDDTNALGGASGSAFNTISKGVFVGHAHGGETGTKGLDDTTGQNIHPMLALNFIIKA